MGLQVEDGKGRGFLAAVTSENRVATSAVSETLDHHINATTGKVWSIPFENIINTGADDYIVYIKNTGSKDLMITDIRIAASAATQVEVHGVTGTAGGGGATLVPVSRTIGSSAAPSATCLSDPDITGLTTAGTLFYIHCAVADTLYHLSTSSHIIIPKSQAVAILVEATTITCTGVISIVEAE